MRRDVPLAVMATVTAFVVVGLLSLPGCIRVPIERDVGEYAEDTVLVEREGAEFAEVRIAMGAGELFVGSLDLGHGQLMKARFDYAPATWAPEVSWAVEGERGELEIRQPRSSGIANLGRGVTNRWEITLAEDVPLSLDVGLGAGVSEFTLGRLDLRELRISTGAGDVLVDLSGADPAGDLRVTIEGGAGAFRVRVPSGVGVRVTGVRDGLGSFQIDGFERDGDDYVNEAYGLSPVTIDLHISRGVGETVVEEVD